MVGTARGAKCCSLVILGPGTLSDCTFTAGSVNSLDVTCGTLKRILAMEGVVDVKGGFPLGPISRLLLVVTDGKVTLGTSGGWISMPLTFMSFLWGLATG